jgi:SAM-dependent methyltransferase
MTTENESSPLGTNRTSQSSSPLDSSTAGQEPEDVFHVARDERYLEQLRAEEDFWDRCPDPFTRASALPRIRLYENERLTGDPERQWFEVISEYGPFTSGCILGAGPGEVETELLRRNPELRLTVYDISGDSLKRLEDSLSPDVAGRVEARKEDLNFATLPAETYDLVVTISSVHHIVNLEHLAYQINQCLKPHGYVFMRDTVGESYFQFSEEKRRLFQTFLDATQDGSGRRRTVHWPDRGDWQYSPFESIRSDEILGVFRRYLHEVRVTTSSALLTLILFTQPEGIQGSSRLKRALSRVRRSSLARLRRLLNSQVDLRRQDARRDLLFLLDSILCDTGYLRPGLAFGIYRKRLKQGAA